MTATIPKKALIALTSNNDVFYEDGSKTGVFWSEAAHPYHVFKQGGFEVQFVSETGSWAPDDHSVNNPDFLSGDDLKEYKDKDSDIHKALKQIKKASDIDPKEYAIFFAAGGHGTLFDFPTAKGLQSILTKIYKNGGVVSAVCHGPAIFAGLKEIVEGKRATCFVSEAEEAMGLVSVLKKHNLETNEAILLQSGAILVKPPGFWDEFAVADGRLVTGVNPASAEATANRALSALVANE